MPAGARAAATASTARTMRNAALLSGLAASCSVEFGDAAVPARGARGDPADAGDLAQVSGEAGKLPGSWRGMPCGDDDYGGSSAPAG